jgi:uncharacterized protein YaeQ
VALKATIFRARVSIADLDRAYFREHTLTVARHPSETDARLMLRLLAFCLHASDTLSFTRGLSTSGEPDVWDWAPDGTLLSWIEVGQPEARRLRSAAGRAARVFVYPYGGHSTGLWWKRVRERVSDIGNLSVREIPVEGAAQLATLAQRNMQLQCTVQDGEVWMTTGDFSLHIAPRTRKA